MKKTLLSSAILLAFVSAANAAAPLSPSLNLPVNNDIVAIKQPLKFTWTAKNPSTIKQYHLIISKSERFMDYDLSKGKCSNANTCADFLVKSASKTLDANHPFLQQESSFYWQVQAIDKSNNKSPIFQGSKNTSTGRDTVRTRVNISQFSVTQKNVVIDDITVTPKEAANGSAFTFTATLSDELPDNHSVKIDYGNGWQIMQGEGLDYSFNLPTFSTTKSIKDQDISYTIAVFDENGEQQGYLEDSFTILSNADIVPVVEKPTPAPTTQPVKVKIPDLLNVNASPSSVAKGNAITFSAKLSDNLPSGYKVKANYNGDWLDMSGSGSIFSLKVTPTNSGTSFFLVSIYDSQNNAITDTPVKSNFSVTELAPIVITPTAVPSSSNFSFSYLGEGECRQGDGDYPLTFSIDYYDLAPHTKGNNAAEAQSRCEATCSEHLDWCLAVEVVTRDVWSQPSCKLVTDRATFEGTGGVLENNQWGGTQHIDSIMYQTYCGGNGSCDHTNWAGGSLNRRGGYSCSIPKNKTAGTDTNSTVPPVVPQATNYVKIANNGSVLSDATKLGTNPTNWACTKDNKTGLLWEIKTADGGLHDMSNFYTNYTSDYPKCGDGCETYYPGRFGDSTNTDGFIKAVNKQGLCGAKNWRLPTKDELMTLISCSDGQYNLDGECANNSVVSPTIDATYFPDVKGNYLWYWSSSPVHDISPDANDVAWSVGFRNGYAERSSRMGFTYHVRLVSGGQ